MYAKGSKGIMESKMVMGRVIWEKKKSKKSLPKVLLIFKHYSDVFTLNYYYHWC